MDYIEKLFKQYPFVYLIDDCFYAFGTGVCAKVGNDRILTASHYSMYIKASNTSVEQYDAWRIFHKLVMTAESVKDENGFNGEVMKDFTKLGFTENQLKQVEEQVQRYIDYFQKYRIKDYL